MGPLFLQGQKAPDPTVALHSRHPQKASIHVSMASREFVVEMPFILVGFLCIIPSPVKCGSWDQRQELSSPSARYHLVLGKGVWGPPGPPFTHEFIQGLTGHWWSRTQHFKGRFLSVGPTCSPLAPQLLPLEFQSYRQCLRLFRVFSSPPLSSTFSIPQIKASRVSHLLSRLPWQFVTLAGRSPEPPMLPLSWSQVDWRLEGKPKSWDSHQLCPAQFGV